MMKDADEMQYLSGSVAELGVRAGDLTWENSQRYSKSYPLLKPNQIEEAKEYFAGYGAWSREEIAAWSDDEVQALVTQEVASLIRELEDYESYDDYMSDAYKGQSSGRIFKGEDGQWYASFYS
jgi:hypothetical protein